MTVTGTTSTNGISNTGNISNTGDISTATLTATGQIKGGSITDGTATLSGGNLSGVNNITGSGNITGFQNGSFTGTVTASKLSAGSGGLTSTGFASLNGGLGVTGGTTTDTLLVTGTSVFKNTATFGAAGNTTIAANGDITSKNIFGDTYGLVANTGNSFGGLITTANIAGTPATTVTGLGVTGFDNGTQTFNISATTGNANFAGTVTSNGLNNTGAFDQTGTATFNGTGANAGTNTTINGAVVTLNGSQGSISLNANQDPILTVTNGTLAGTTQINNGAVFAGTSITTPTVNAVAGNFGVVNAVVANAVQVNAGNLAVAPGGTVDMGGNVVHDVATPILGTDAANKAYVDTTVGRAKQQAFEGTAVALAISQPILLPGQTFAIRGGWGDFEGQNAAGFSAAGVVAHDVFGYGSTLTVDAGVGVGTSFSGVGAKAGVTIGFGGTGPLK